MAANATATSSVGMACFWLNQQETDIQIPSVEEVCSITFYKIQVTVGEARWFATHRYNDFYDLHNQLVTDHGVSKDILPPKKVIRNKCPEFIENRRKGLESYLKSVYNYLQRTMPRIFVEFLDFQHYDILYLLKTMALQLYVEADSILSSTKSYTFSPLEVHAISECFKKPFPAIEESDKRCDISHVLDLCSQLHHLTILGSNVAYLNSNIIPNSLSIQFSSFKSLQTLEMNEVGFEHVTCVGLLRDCLTTLKVHKTPTQNVCQILQCDVLHKTNVDGGKAWRTIKTLDLSCNYIVEVDNSITLVPQLKTLILNNNKLTSIPNLTSLVYLTRLSISNNLISTCDQLHTKLGNLKYINLAGNQITSLEGFAKLYSLASLDVSCNQISDIEEINYIGKLPYLEILILTGNLVATTVDYRIKVFEPFGARAKEICLDNEKPSQQEIDKVSILQALRIVKEGKTPTFNYLNNSYSINQ